MQYGRRVARNAAQRADLERTKYIAEMNAYFRSIDSFDLAEETADASDAPPHAAEPTRAPSRRFSFQSRLTAPLEPLAETDLPAVPCSPSSDACSSVYQEALSSPRQPGLDSLASDDDSSTSGTPVSSGTYITHVDKECIHIRYTGGVPPAAPGATVLRTQRPLSLGLSRRSSLCITHLPSTRARQALPPHEATPDSPSEGPLSESGALPSESGALSQQQVKDEADGSELQAVLSPLRQLDLNTAVVATPMQAKTVKDSTTAAPSDDGDALSALLRLCGQTVRDFVRRPAIQTVMHSPTRGIHQHTPKKHSTTCIFSLSTQLCNA